MVGREVTDDDLNELLSDDQIDNDGIVYGSVFEEDKKEEKLVPQSSPDTGFNEYVKQDLDFRRNQLAEQQRQALQTKQQELESQRRQSLEKRYKEIDSTLDSIIPKTDDIYINEELYNSQTQQVIQHLAKKQAAEIVKNVAEPMRQLWRKNIEQEEKIEQLRNQFMDPQKQFEDRLINIAPDAAQILNSDGWEPFKRKSSGETGITYGELVEFAHSRGDVHKVKQIMDIYKNSNTMNKAEIISPKSRNNSGPSLQSNKVMLKQSELEKAWVKRDLGQIDEATLRKIEAQFERAAIENRVDYSK